MGSAKVPMKIRKATVSDAPVLMALNQGVQDMHADAVPGRFRRNVPEETVERAFGTMIQEPSSYWLVAEEDQPIAFLSAEFRERDESWCSVSHRICYVAGIVVAPRFRRRGIAKALLGELKREADARGVTSIELDVWAFNEEARRVFTRLGFRRTVERMTLVAKEPNEAPEPTPGGFTPHGDA
jgi:ribosomal protein S18 acetylase RimI-like enzyme